MSIEKNEYNPMDPEAAYFDIDEDERIYPVISDYYDDLKGISLSKFKKKIAKALK